ncbi:MAG: hypothetical protein ACREBS_09665 [Nitrososphaerales archaeon]
MARIHILIATSICLLFFIAPLGIVTPAAQAQSTPAFSTAVNLSSDTGLAKQPAVANYGQNVYVVWTEGGKGIFFRVSTDGGTSWTPSTTSPALKLSNNGGVAQFPVMFTQFQQVNTGDVYAAWSQTVNKVLQVFIAASNDNGLTFKAVQLSTAGGITPAIAASGSDVYVSWYQNTHCPGGSAGSGCIWVSSSTDNGQTWGAPVQLNPNHGVGEEQIVASGHNAYVTADGIYFEATYNDGGTWSTPILLYNSSQISPPCSPFCFGREPWIAADGLNVYVTWESSNPAQTSGSTPNYKDYGRTSNDGGKTWNPPLSNPMPQLLTGTVRNDWEPENAAFGNTAFLTFHSLASQSIWVTSTIDSGLQWSAPHRISPIGQQSAFAHVYTSDGLNVFVMWGQAIAKGSSVWNAYVSYSGNSGKTWSSPIDISNNANGIAAGNKDVTLFALSSNGAHCFAAWTYTSGTTSQVYFASS